MTITYTLNDNELNGNFLKAIKTLFKGKKLYITIEADMDETEYLLASEANRNMLEKSIAEAESGNLIKVNIGNK
jgi:hypothetical protein